MILCTVSFLEYYVVYIYLSNIISWVGVIRGEVQLVFNLIRQRFKFVFCMNNSDCESFWIIISDYFSIPLKNSSSLWDFMWVIYLHFACLSIYTRNLMTFTHTKSMHNSMYELFCISSLESECRPLLPGLVWSLLTCLWEFTSMVYISFYRCLYLPLIL